MQTHPETVYRFGPFEVDGTTGVLLKNGSRIKLQDQPCRLLLALLERLGEVVSREELLTRLWQEDTFVDFEGSLRAVVRRLREVLDDDAESPRYIETIPKRGYRFLGTQVQRKQPALEKLAEQEVAAPTIPNAPGLPATRKAI